MRGWSRREVLAALAAAGAAPAWAGLLGPGCGAGAAGGARGRGAERARDAADLRAQLRMLVAELSPRFRVVRARAEIASSTRVAVEDGYVEWCACRERCPCGNGRRDRYVLHLERPRPSDR